MNSLPSFWTGRIIPPAVLAALLLIGLTAITSMATSPLPKTWIDDANGYAIGGYDPVDYFVKKEAISPPGGIETFWGGGSWKFSNIGNRAAFLAHPRTYAPRFGGADPYLLARQRPVLGNPTLFDIYEDRLYLFYSGVTLSRWKEHRAAFIIHAKQFWPKISKILRLDAAEPVDPADPTLLKDTSLCEPARWLKTKTKQKLP
jgi:hypothetical protein